MDTREVTYSPEEKSIRFNVIRPLTLDAVYIYANKTGKLTLALKDAKGEIVCKDTFQVRETDTKFRIPLQWELNSCQNYEMCAWSDKGNIQLYANDQVDFLTGFLESFC